MVHVFAVFVDEVGRIVRSGRVKGATGGKARGWVQG